MKKRLVAAVMAMVLCSTLLQGCGTKTSNSVGETNVSGKVDVSAYAPIEGKEYTFDWVFYQTAPLNENAYMKDYWEKKYNVKFNVWDIEQSQMAEIINQRIIGGEIPDRFISDEITLEKYVDQNVVAEIPMEVLEKYAPNLIKHIKQDVPEALEYCKIDGKLYALPNYSMYPTRNPVIWRGDWLENVGINKMPETLDEFEEAIYKFTKEDPDKNGIADTYGMSNTIMPAVYGAFGYIPIVAGANTYTEGNWQSRDGKLVHSAVQPEMKDALRLLSKWYADGVIDPEFVTGENQGGYWALSHAFIGGRIGVTGLGSTYHWSPKLFEDTTAGVNIEEIAKINPNAAEKVIVGIPPKGPDGKQGTWANPTMRTGKFCFGKQLEKEPDKFGKLLQIYNDMYENSSSFSEFYDGLEGVMYTKETKKSLLNGKEYEIKRPIEPYVNDKALNTSFANTAFAMFRPSFKDEMDFTNGVQWDWEYSVFSDKYHMSNELMAVLPSDKKYKAELTKLVQETYISIITGEKPIDYFDSFVERWNQIGGETLVKEANEWYSKIKE